MANPNVAFLGTPSVALPPLRTLAEACGVSAVFCNPDRPKGRGHIVEPPPVKIEALSLGLNVYQPETWKDNTIRQLWDSLEIDTAIVVAYGHILPSWMLDSCKLGAWNLHFSLLPRWRGAAPVNHAIMAGDNESGVSLMKITPGLDAGPVLAQRRRPVTMMTYADALLAELAEDAATLLEESLNSIFNGSAIPVPQDEKLVTHAPKLKKEMARLDISKEAAELHRQIRALQPWPGAEIQVNGTIVKILSVGQMAALDLPPGTLQWDNGGAWLSVGKGSSIELVSLQRPGKPPQPARQVMQYWGTHGHLHV